MKKVRAEAWVKLVVELIVHFDFGRLVVQNSPNYVSEKA
jgi:hypothetical protein